MQRTKIMLTVVFLIILFVACSATTSIKNDTTNELSDIKMVSVFNFICSDPVIANHIRNIIIESLLTRYSVVIGNEADIVIKGSIILSSDQVANASPGRTEGFISEISAHIIKNNRILDSAIVTQVNTNSSTPDTPEVMGRKIGEKIKKALSHTLSFTQ